MNAAAAGEKVRIFIGTEPKAEIARKVLECSIQRRTEAECVFVPMIGKDWEYSTKHIKVGTGFSLRRWMIPAACNWKGKAIYLDADQIVFSDIWDLWTKPETTKSLPGCSAWMSYQPDKYSSKPWPQSSVMVIDCGVAEGQTGWYIGQALEHLKKDSDRKRYADFMHCTWMKTPPCRIGDEWNHLNVYHPGKTKLLHYTREPDQPWYNPGHPHAQLWQQELEVAISRGAVTPEEIRKAVSMFGVTEDWRTTNGLHPDYLRFLDDIERKNKGKK